MAAIKEKRQKRKEMKQMEKLKSVVGEVELHEAAQKGTDAAREGDPPKIKKRKRKDTENVDFIPFDDSAPKKKKIDFKSVAKEEETEKGKGKKAKGLKPKKSKEKKYKPKSSLPKSK